MKMKNTGAKSVNKKANIINTHECSMCKYKRVCRTYATTACIMPHAAGSAPAQFGNQRISSAFRNVTHYAVRYFVPYCRSNTVVIHRNFQQRASVAQKKIVGMDAFDLGVHEIVDVLQARALQPLR